MNYKDSGRRSPAQISILLALLSAVILFLYINRRFFLRALRDGLHGGPVYREDAPETAGRTIRWAGVYDLVSNLLMLGRGAEVQEGIVSLAQIMPGDQVLDVGCGTGSIALAATRRVGPDGVVIGLDASPEMIAVARRKAEQQGAQVSFDVGVVEKLPYENGRFDIVINSLVLHHLPDDLKAQAFGEIYRVLRPGGRFYAVDFEPPSNRLSRGFYGLFLGDDMMFNDISSLAGLPTKAGFKDVQVGLTGLPMLAYLSGRKPLAAEAQEGSDLLPG